MRITKVKAREILRDVQGGERFFNADGNVFTNLRELSLNLRRVPQEVFNCHCSSQKCDFASWIEDILHDSVLANALRKAKGVRAKVEKLIADRIAQLEKYE